MPKRYRIQVLGLNTGMFFFFGGYPFCLGLKGNQEEHHHSAVSDTYIENQRICVFEHLVWAGLGVSTSEPSGFRVPGKPL